MSQAIQDFYAWMDTKPAWVKVAFVAAMLAFAIFVFRVIAPRMGLAMCEPAGPISAHMQSISPVCW